MCVHILSNAKIILLQILGTHQILTNRSAVADVIKRVSSSVLICCNSLPWAGNFLIGLLPLEGPSIGHNFSDTLPVNNESPMIDNTTIFCLSADQHLVMSCDLIIYNTVTHIWMLKNTIHLRPKLYL